MKNKVISIYSEIIHKLDLWNNTLYFIILTYLKVAMDLFFVIVVSEIYPYHYYLINGSGYKYILSWVFFIALIVLVPKEEKSLKTFFLHIQLVIMILPMLTLYAFTTNGSTKYMLMVTLATVLEIIILKKEKKKYKPVKIKRFGPFVSVFMIVAIPLLTILIVNFGGFFGMQAFDLQALNLIRENENYPAIVSYMIMWLTNIIIPFYVVYSLETKHYIAAVLLIFDDLILYMVWAHKAVYLALIITLAVYVVSKTGHLIKLMYIGVSVLLTGLIIVYLVEKSGNVSSLTTISVSFLGDRFFYGPALNKFLYYQVFSTYPKLYFSDGMIGRFMGLTYLYRYAPGQMVFAHIWGGRYGDSNSCTGYLGDGYAQMGVLGVLGGAVLLALLVKYIDNYCGTIGFGVLAAIIALYVSILNDTPLHTTIISGGLFIFLILLAVYARVNKPKGEENYD